MKIKTNPSDTMYPIQACDHQYYGLTIRQHFASLAMQGLAASGLGINHTSDEIAKFSVQFADELIKELNK